MKNGRADPGGRLWPEGRGDIWLRTRRERLQKMLGLDEITMVDEVEIVEFFAKSDLMMHVGTRLCTDRE